MAPGAPSYSAFFPILAQHVHPAVIRGPKSSGSQIGRISRSLGPGIGLGQRFAHSIASSIDWTCQIQNPATSSFALAKGPSVLPGQSPATDFFVPTGFQYAKESFRGGFLVTDGHHNRVLRVSRDGEITQLITVVAAGAPFLSTLSSAAAVRFRPGAGHLERPVRGNPGASEHRRPSAGRWEGDLHGRG